MKISVLLLVLCLFGKIFTVLADGTESFSLFDPGTTAYSTGSYTGDNGIEWFYTKCRKGQETTTNDNEAIQLAKDAGATVYSQAIPNGCASLTFQYEQELTTDVNAQVFINQQLVGTLTTSDEADKTKVFSVDNLNIAGSFVIKIMQTNGSSGQLTIDDIQWKSYVVSLFDNDSKIEAGVFNEPDAILSTSDSEANPSDVFDFTITDKASGDERPTKIRQLQITPAATNTINNWQNYIAGAVLEAGNLTASAEIQPAGIRFDFTQQLVVADGESQTCMLKIWLHPYLLDFDLNDKLGFAIHSKNILFDVNGSGFGDYSIETSMISIKIEATQLVFTQIPSNTGVNQAFDVTVLATDKNGNTAPNTDAELQLTVANGNGELAFLNNAIQTMENGSATWTLKYNKIKSIVLECTETDAQFASITSKPIIITGDKDSKTEAPEQQVPEAKILSITDSYGSAVEVFRFAIHDMASFDNKPTIPVQLHIKNANPDNSADWSNTICGAKLILNNDSTIATQSEITDDGIIIKIKKEELIIADGGKANLSLWIYLNKKNVEDHTRLQFFIDNTAHNCITDSSGSLFSDTFTEKIISNVFVIEVDATQLTFSVQPEHPVGVNMLFAVEVQATDQNGNCDFDANQSIEIQTEIGTGQLQSVGDMTVQLQNGRYYWHDLQYNKPEHFTILATCSTLRSAISDIIPAFDGNSATIHPVKQTGAKNIDSKNTNVETACTIFRFSVDDKAISDETPTVVKEVNIKNTNQQNSADWTKTIQHVILINSQTKDTILTESVEIETNEMKVTIAQNNLKIPDGETIEVEMLVSLKPNGIIDKSTLQCYIKADDHDFETEPVSSRFAAQFEYDVVSAIHTIDVNANRLHFTACPAVVQQNRNFAIRASATDNNGNIDSDAKVTIELTADLPENFTAQEPLSTNLQNGTWQWNTLQFQDTGYYCLQLSDKENKFTNTISSFIYVAEKVDTLFSDDFEDNHLLQWQHTGDWKTSAYKPISGAFSLKHHLMDKAGNSLLYAGIDSLSMGGSLLVWHLKIKNGDWMPSGENRFHFFIASDTPVTQTGIEDINGYAVGINQKENNNRLCLTRYENGRAVNDIVATDFFWNENNSVEITIIRYNTGEWQLRVSQKHEKTTTYWTDTGFDNELDMFKYFGLYFSYTSTRAGKLWFDNFLLTRANMPPDLHSFKILNNNTIKIQFTEAIDTLFIKQQSVFRLEKSGAEIPVNQILIDEQHPGIIYVKTDNLTEGDYKLIMENIKDTENAISESMDFEFDYSQGTSSGNLLITEIMADPGPVVGLPEIEYIEIFNPATENVFLSEWSVCKGNTCRYLPDTTEIGEPTVIKPGEYLALCHLNSYPKLSNYGNALGVPGFPAITNSDDIVLLLDPAGRCISAVEYSENWHTNNYKAEGGWSLEQIDPANPCGGSNNWTSSVAEAGGTPGQQNSVYASNVDTVAPQLLYISVLSDTVIQLTFNETLDTLGIQNLNSYSFDNEDLSLLAARTIQPLNRQVQLLFHTPIETGTIYRLTLNKTIADCAGNTIQKTTGIPFALPEKPLSKDIVINEILVDPYPECSEFVELYNNSDKVIDFTDMLLATKDLHTDELENIKPVAENSRLFFPETYMVLTDDSASILQHYSVKNPGNFVQMETFPALNNTDVDMVLLTKSLTIIDELRYNEEMHFGILNDIQGVTLERIHPDRPSDERANWHSAAESIGFGTPSYENSQFRETAEDSNEEIKIEPELFSPDGDGYNDVLNIHYNVLQPGFVANIVIFDSKGRKIIHLINNELLAANGIFAWDGTNVSGDKCKIGIYLIYIELFDLEGNIKKYKKTCVLANRL